MTVRDNSAIPSSQPTSRGAPCVPQPGAAGSLSARLSSFAPPPMESILRSGFSLEYKDTRQGQFVEAADFDDGDIDEARPVTSEPGASGLQTLDDFVQPTPGSIRTSPISLGGCHQAQPLRLPQHQRCLLCPRAKCTA